MNLGKESGQFSLSLHQLLLSLRCQPLKPQQLSPRISRPPQPSGKVDQPVAQEQDYNGHAKGICNGHEKDCHGFRCPNARLRNQNGHKEEQEEDGDAVKEQIDLYRIPRLAASLKFTRHDESLEKWQD